jgi:hypothetical protein
LTVNSLGKRLISFFVILIFLLGMPSRARADTSVVTLTRFDAVGNHNEIDLFWDTASELDNSGFYINRSTSLTGARERIQVSVPGYDTPLDLIQSTGDSVTGASYIAFDENVVDNVSYYYWVESLSNNGSSTFSPSREATTLVDNPITTTPTATSTGTVTATPTGTPTGTLTPNPAFTSTATVTPGGPTNTTSPTMIASPTRTRAPTLTPNYSLQATTPPLPLISSTPLTVTPGTIVPTDTATATSTPTLAPLPSLTLLFPLVTDTATPTPPDPAAEVQSSSSSSGSAQYTGMSPDVMLLIAVIVIIWMLLGAFLFLYIRRIGTGA